MNWNFEFQLLLGQKEGMDPTAGRKSWVLAEPNLCPQCVLNVPFTSRHH